MKKILKIKKNIGFVLLFAVTLAAIILSITLGITNIAYNEVRFSSNARDTNDAFFAADSGLECASLYDVDTSDFSLPSTTEYAFLPYNSPFHHLASITCNGNSSIVITPIPSNYSSSPISYTFVVPKLGARGNSCAIVTVKKTDTAGGDVTSSKGYNNDASDNCDGTSSSRLEREVHTTILP